MPARGASARTDRLAARAARATRVANAPHVAVRRGFVSSGRSEVLQIGGKGRLVVLETAWSINCRLENSIESGTISPKQ